MQATSPDGERGLGPVVRFCRQLAEVRAASGLSVRQVAVRIQFSKTHLYDILSGRIAKPPDWDSMVEPFLRTCLQGDRGAGFGHHSREMAIWRRRHDVLCEVHEELRQERRAWSRSPGVSGGELPSGAHDDLPSGVQRVPPRNRLFTGREALLEELHDLLGHQQTVTVHALRGMGGVGKTQTVIEYAHRHRQDYELIWWVDAEVTSGIRGQLGEMLVALGLPPSADLVTTLTVLDRTLARIPRYLLVFDNAENVDDLRPFLPMGPGRIVITTRRGGFRAVGSVIDVDVLDHQDAIALLRVRCPSLSPQDADEVASRLGDLPLALDQAGAYLDRTGMPPGDYLRLLRTRALELFEKAATGGRSRTRNLNAGYPHTVATVWSLSIERLIQESPSAAQLLAVAAWFAPEPIPLEVFTVGSEHLPTPLRETARDPLDLVECLTALTDYSLARRTPSGLLLHRLVQDVVRARSVGAWPHGTDPRQTMLDLTTAYLSENPWGQAEVWPRYRQMLPHVLAMADSTLVADARRVAPMLTRTGLYLQRQGSHQEACTIHQAAVRLWETSPDATTGELATELHHLGRALAGRQMFTEALPLQEHALNLVLEAGSPEDPQVAVALNNVGRALAGLGRHAEAVPLHRRALAVRTAALGTDHPTVATDLHFLAQALGSLGEHQEALALHERALRIREAAVGPQHPDVASHRRGVGRTLVALGRYAEAIPVLQEVLHAHLATYGELHSEICADLADIAVALQYLGQEGEAADLLDRAIVIHDRSLRS